MKVKNLINACLLMIFMACGTASNDNKTENKTNEEASSSAHLFLLGTYTNSPDQGIHLMAFHPNEGKIQTISTAAAVENPSFVIANKAQDLVYAVEENGGKEGGKITSFSLINGKLQKLNSVKASAKSPCYITLDPSEFFAVTANYSSGDFSVIPIAENGEVKPVTQVIAHTGSSVVTNRQKEPHVHAAIFHPIDGNLFIADLGTDEVVVYEFDNSLEKPVNPEPIYRLKVAPGAGPRHMVFNSKGDKLYLIHEISAEIGVYSYDQGELKHQATHSLIAEGFEGKVGAAEVRLSPDGKFLYASNRGEANEIIAFKIKENGDLTHVQTVSSMGKAPRNFNITNDGKYLLAGNQDSNTILSFERNLDSGELKPMDTKFEIHKPVYINFLP
ncbi:lactonase family protein [Cyclobacterium marinum]|uniref:lactonase family protein n=1 Tax=Cyclobacterium marinum TaxID=104 RepID=UPI001F551890|nr:lactonase family protein [Cyclobacterium marinum]